MIILFLEELATASRRCVHFIDGLEGVDPSARNGASGLLFLEIPGSVIRSKDQLLSVITQQMKFPPYFGKNSDAVDEGLRDLSWLPSSGYVLVFLDAEEFWRDRSRLAGWLVETWLFVAEYWLEKGVPFHLVFVW